MEIVVKSFFELNTQELYQLLQLRSEVFVVEQNCAYQDMDNYDQVGQHVLAYEDDKLVGCARIQAPGDLYTEAAIGRIVTKKSHRMIGLGKQLMDVCINEISRQHPASPVRLMAQCYLKKFYRDFGFKEVGEEFLEDGIPHVYMLLNSDY